MPIVVIHHSNFIFANTLPMIGVYSHGHFYTHYSPQTLISNYFIFLKATLFKRLIITIHAE
jgi:hypothetical protein